MSSYYSKRVKSKQIQNTKAMRARQRKRNHKTNGRNDDSFGSEFYSPPANTFVTKESQTIATFLRQCKRGGKGALKFISTTTVSKSTMLRGLEIALTFGHTQLVKHFLELGVAENFSFRPLDLHPALHFWLIFSTAAKTKNLRFCEYFADQIMSQGNLGKHTFLSAVRTLMKNDDVTFLRILLNSHHDPASLIEEAHLLDYVLDSNDVVEVLMEYKPIVTPDTLDHCIEGGYVSAMETLLKCDKTLLPKHSIYPLPRLLNLDMDRDVILSQRELNVVRMLVKYGADLHEKDEDMNLLHEAAIQLQRDDRNGREVMDFMFEFMFEFDYMEKCSSYDRKVVDWLPSKYQKEYEMKMVERIKVVREILCEGDQVPWDCGCIIVVCLFGEAVRMLSLM